MTASVASGAPSLDDFLVWENAQPGRHEFHRGVVQARPDLRRVHGCVTSNLARVLGEALDGTACQVFAHSLKLQIGSDTIVYPDLFVTCDLADATELHFQSINCRVPIAHVFAGVEAPVG